MDNNTISGDSLFGMSEVDRVLERLKNFLRPEDFGKLEPFQKALIVIEGKPYSGQHTLAYGLEEQFGLKVLDFSKAIEKYISWLKKTNEEKIILEGINRELVLKHILERQEKGALISDVVTNRIFDQYFIPVLDIPTENFSRPFVLIGYPKNQNQIFYLEKILEKKDIKAIMVYLNVDQKDSMARMEADEKPRPGNENIGNSSVRLRKIQEHNLGMLGITSLLTSEGRALEINASKSPEIIKEEIVKKLVLNNLLQYSGA